MLFSLKVGPETLNRCPSELRLRTIGSAAVGADLALTELAMIFSPAIRTIGICGVGSTVLVAAPRNKGRAMVPA